MFVVRDHVKNRKIGWLFILLALLALAFGAWRILPLLEKESPTVTFSGWKPALGLASTFAVTVSDHKSGLKKVAISLLANGREYALAEYSGPGPKVQVVKSRQFDISLEPAKMGIPDGRALLRVLAQDYSWRGFLKGNRTYIEKEVTIDTRKPEVEVLSRQHYINQGGAGLVIYRVFEPGTVHGVQVGEKFFPGYAGQLDNADVCLAFYAVAHDQPPEVSLMVSVTDAAGNTARAGFYHLIKAKAFPEDRIVISDGFLNMKMPEFDVPAAVDNSLEKFKIINSDMRARNNETIRSQCARSDGSRHWQGTFLRFPNSAPRAGFADRRVYEYNGKFIGRAVHMGVDLASTANSPVPAANNGRVAFAGNIGIYGRAVIIDHGLGLFSLYSHLSHIAVAADQSVEKGDIIGRSGMTGLAGGDHLHYGMLVHDTFVNPIEWWDASWIANNITDKMEMIRQTLAVK